MTRIRRGIYFAILLSVVIATTLLYYHLSLNDMIDDRLADAGVIGYCRGTSADLWSRTLSMDTLYLEPAPGKQVFITGVELHRISIKDLLFNEKLIAYQLNVDSIAVALIAQQDSSSSEPQLGLNSAIAIDQVNIESGQLRWKDEGDSLLARFRATGLTIHPDQLFKEGQWAVYDLMYFMSQESLLVSLDTLEVNLVDSTRKLPKSQLAVCTLHS